MRRRLLRACRIGDGTYARASRAQRRTPRSIRGSGAPPQPVGCVRSLHEREHDLLAREMEGVARAPARSSSRSGRSGPDSPRTRAASARTLPEPAHECPRTLPLPAPRVRRQVPGGPGRDAWRLHDRRSIPQRRQPRPPGQAPRAPHASGCASSHFCDGVYRNAALVQETMSRERPPEPPRRSRLPPTPAMATRGAHRPDLSSAATRETERRAGSFAPTKVEEASSGEIPSPPAHKGASTTYTPTRPAQPLGPASRRKSSQQLRGESLQERGDKANDKD